MAYLQETYHGFRLIPLDGRPHRDDTPPAEDLAVEDYVRLARALDGQ